MELLAGEPLLQALRDRSIYRIPRGNLAGLDERIAKLNRRGAKIGAAPILVTLVATERQKEMVPDPKKPLGAEKWTGRYFYYDYAKVEGEAPKLSGWTLLASLEIGEGGTIIRSVPGREVPKEYRNAELKCDHCKKIRNRKEHFLVKHEDGRVAQVGRNCIADFLGNIDPKHIANLASYLRSLDGLGDEPKGGWGAASEPVYELRYFLAIVSATIARYGWLSKSQAQKNYEAYGKSGSTTSERVLRQLNPRQFITASEVAEFVEVLPAHEAEADEAIAWVKSWAHDLSDFESNLKVLVGRGEIVTREAGFSAAIISSYQRHLGKFAERAAKREAQKASVHIGTIGKRESFTFTVLFQRDSASEWGITTFYKLQDGAGNIATYWSSRGLDLDNGATFTAKATVKAHEVYDGINQTKLTRVSVTSVNLVAAGVK